MRDGVILSPRSTQPQIAPCIDPNSPFARGLAFFAPMSPGAPALDLVSGVRATATGAVNEVSTRSGQVLREFGTGKYLDFNRKPVGVGPTTPTTIAWTQEARGTTGASCLLLLQVGTPTLDRQFAIYQSSDGGSAYHFTAGPRVALGAHSWSIATGALTNNVLDVFVLVAAAGIVSLTATDWTLYRNGRLVTRGTSTSFTASLADIFRVGAFDPATTDPFEGGIGNLGIWSRAWTEAEVVSWTRNQNQLFPPQQRRIWIPVEVYRPGSDITTTGWTASVGTDLFACIDENPASDSDFISNDDLTTSVTMGWAIPLPAGSWNVDVRSQFIGVSGQIRMVLMDAASATVGTTAWQPLTGVYATYTLPVTTSAVSTKFRFEVQA